MALFQSRSAAMFGIEAYLIDVEVDMYNGSACDFVTVGMPDTAVRKSRERIKLALINRTFSRLLVAPVQSARDTGPILVDDGQSRNVRHYRAKLFEGAAGRCDDSEPT
jgi:hypothetical protein